MNHAVTRIISFLLLALFLASGKVSILIFCCAITTAIYSLDPPEDVPKVFRSIMRMKWFFLSIMLVYLFINNTTIDFSTQLLEGLKRIMILIIMMLLISWFMSKTPRDQIISALVFLLSPLKIFRFPIETMALRIELVLRNIDDVQMILLEKKDQMRGNIKSVNEIAKTVSGLYFDMLETIDAKPLEEVTVDLQPKASAGQWFLPIILFVLLLLIQNYP